MSSQTDRDRAETTGESPGGGSLLGIVVLALVALSLPFGIVALRGQIPGPAPKLYSGGSSFPASTLPLHRGRVGPELQHPPRITNVQIVDFDDDGRPDVIACDARTNQVLWYRQQSAGDWEEIVLGEDLIAPAHATVVDLDGDGDRDVVVSILGSIWPSDEVIGRVVWLEQQNGRFTEHVILDDVRRVADVQPGDLDEDGDVDLVVAVFGYARGQILWLEHRESGRFREHELLVAPGTIHVPLADYDADGDLDITAIVSQNDEELWGFENLGSRNFQPRRLYFNVNFDLGSAGLVRTDLDSDGDADLLLPVGDNLEDRFTYPQPYHGCFWFENQGGWNFAAHRIATFGGTYAAAAGDLDGDRDQDVVLVSMFNEWEQPGHASIVWLENDGRQNFRTWQIDEQPTHLVTVACGDLNGDGRDDVAAGGLHLYSPFDRLGRITSWTSQADGSP